METFKQPFDVTPGKQTKTQKRLVPFFTAIYFIFGIVKIYYNDVGEGITWLILGIGIYFATIMNTSRYFFELNNKGIVIKNSFFSSLEFAWKDIEKLIFHPITIDIVLKSGEKHEFTLANLTYNSVIVFKEKLQEFAKAKGIKLY